MNRTPNPNPGQHNIIAWAYYAEAQCLEIEFQGGRIYRYFKIEPWRAEEFGGSSSLGRYHGLHIRNNKSYPYLLVQNDAIDPAVDDYLNDAFAWPESVPDVINDERMFERARDAYRADTEPAQVRRRGRRLL